MHGGFDLGDRHDHDKACSNAGMAGPGGTVVEPRAVRPAEDSDRKKLACPPARLPWSTAALVIVVLSAALWLGIIRLLRALF